MDMLRCGAVGLGKYEAVFRENEIDETVLPNLTAEDLKELGVAAVGHRLLLDAIAVVIPTATPGTCGSSRVPSGTLLSVDDEDLREVWRLEKTKEEEAMSAALSRRSLTIAAMYGLAVSMPIATAKAQGMKPIQIPSQATRTLETSANLNRHWLNSTARSILAI